MSEPEQEQEWQLIDGEESQCGPYTAEELQDFASDGTITPDTLLWTDRLEEWIPASEVEGLFPSQAQQPRLLTGAAVPAGSVLGSATAADRPSGAPIRVAQPRTGITTVIILCIIISLPIIAIVGLCVALFATGEIHLVPEPGESEPALGLYFDGNDDWMEVSPFEWSSLDSFTLEAWVRDWDGVILNRGTGGDPENSLWLALGPEESRSPYSASGWEYGRGSNVQVAFGEWPAGQWNHVAMVFDGKEQSLYLNGRLKSRRAAPRPGPFSTNRPLTIGMAKSGENSRSFGKGLLRSVRVSATARYDQEFEPEALWQRDSDTMLLMGGQSGGDGSTERSRSERAMETHGVSLLISLGEEEFTLLRSDGKTEVLPFEKPERGDVIVSP